MDRRKQRRLNWSILVYRGLKGHVCACLGARICLHCTAAAFCGLSRTFLGLSPTEKDILFLL